MNNFNRSGCIRFSTERDLYNLARERAQASRGAENNFISLINDGHGAGSRNQVNWSFYTQNIQQPNSAHSSQQRLPQ